MYKKRAFKWTFYKLYHKRSCVRIAQHSWGTNFCEKICVINFLNKQLIEVMSSHGKNCNFIFFRDRFEKMRKSFSYFKNKVVLLSNRSKILRKWERHWNEGKQKSQLIKIGYISFFQDIKSVNTKLSVLWKYSESYVWISAFGVFILEVFGWGDWVTLRVLSPTLSPLLHYLCQMSLNFLSYTW